MLDIERIAKEIREEKDNAIAKAFTCQIASLIIANGIVPIMTEHSFDELETITDSNRYKMVYRFGVTFDSLDTSEHDKQIYNQALEDMANKIKEYSGDHYIDCDGYYGRQTESVFRTEDFLDDVLSELKK